MWDHELPLYYGLDGHDPVPVSMMEWATQFELRIASSQLGGDDPWRVARTELPGGAYVSTVFLGRASGRPVKLVINPVDSPARRGRSIGGRSVRIEPVICTQGIGKSGGVTREPACAGDGVAAGGVIGGADGFGVNRGEAG